MAALACDEAGTMSCVLLDAVVVEEPATCLLGLRNLVVTALWCGSSTIVCGNISRLVRHVLAEPTPHYRDLHGETPRRL